MSLKYLYIILTSIMLSIILMNCSDNTDILEIEEKAISTVKSTPIIDFIYVNSYPHDITSFTEGFLVYNGDLYESTGATNELPQTKSLFGIIDSVTGKIDTKVELERTKYFGEGITFLGGKVYQLTYKAKIGFIYDAITFKELGEFTLPTKEGWGLTTDGVELIMSDGTNNLTFMDSKSLNVTKTIPVSENGNFIDKLNELEYINGFIYANIWTTNTIVKINPDNGQVVGKLDLTSLMNEVKYIYPHSLEMNGIAFDSIADKIYITGKMWPKYFEIKFNH